MMTIFTIISLGAIFETVADDGKRMTKRTTVYFDGIDKFYLFFRRDTMFGIIPLMNGGRDQFLGKRCVFQFIPRKLSQRSSPMDTISGLMTQGWRLGYSGVNQPTAKSSNADSFLKGR